MNAVRRAPYTPESNQGRRSPNAPALDLTPPERRERWGRPAGRSQKLATFKKLLAFGDHSRADTATRAPPEPGPQADRDSPGPPNGDAKEPITATQPMLHGGPDLDTETAQDGRIPGSA